MTVAFTWIIPSQGLEYLVTRELIRGEAFTERQGIVIGVALTAVEGVRDRCEHSVLANDGLLAL